MDFLHFIIRITKLGQNDETKPMKLGHSLADLTPRLRLAKAFLEDTVIPAVTPNEETFSHLLR